MKIVIAIFLIMMAAGCSTSETINHPIPTGFFPDFKGEGFCIDLWLQNQPLPPGTETEIESELEPRIQLAISNFLPSDVFMRVEVADTVETIVPPPDSPEAGRRNPLRVYGRNDNPAKDEYLLLRGRMKTKDNYRGPDSYHRWLSIPSKLKHFKVDGKIKIFYYLVGDPKQYIQEKEFNFIVKRK